MRPRRSHLASCTLALAALLVVPACGNQDTGSSSQATAPKSVDRLNALTRGELAAVDTYRQAIEKDGSAATHLSALRRNHEDATAQLGARVRALGGTPPTDSGIWGDFAKAVQGTAKVFGNDAAMRALKAGEEQGTRSYEAALADADLDPVSASLIRETLLPRQRGHAEILKRLIDAPAGTSVDTTGSVSR